MAKFYRRRFSRSGPRDKYSVEQRISKGTLQPLAGADPAFQQVVAVVPASTVQGMRKVKHVTVNLTCDAEHLYWALIYVPGGTTPSPITAALQSMYEPNQFVMNCGIVDPSAGPVRISSPVSRNLNSGDTIQLVVGNETAVDFFAVCRYAITLQ